jgi:quercetin dioxygenase-like cupin family protein
MKTGTKIELVPGVASRRDLKTRTAIAPLAAQQGSEQATDNNTIRSKIFPFMHRTFIALSVCAAIGAGGVALEKSSVAPAAEGPRRASLGETVTRLADQPVPNIPGKRLLVDAVDYAPGGYSASHRHAGSAFIYAYVVSGEVRSQVNDEPVRVYKAGEQWFENPGSHHRVSENASATKPARLIAVIILDATEKEATLPEKGKE